MLSKKIQLSPETHKKIISIFLILLSLLASISFAWLAYKSYRLKDTADRYYSQDGKQNLLVLSPVPYYFESFTPRGNSRALVRLTGVRSLKDADELAGAAVYADYFEEEAGEDLTGWTVVDAASGVAVGTVTDFEDIPGNTCLWVRRPDGQEVLLPFHEDLLAGMDQKTGTLTLSIPEGILDL